MNSMITDARVNLEELEKKISLLEAENKTLKQREFSILRALPEIVFMIDINERFVFLNNTCLEKFKLTQKDVDRTIKLKDIIIGKSVYHLRKLYLSEPDKETLQAREIVGVRKDGSYFPFTACFTRLMENGKVKGFIGVGFDLTDRITVEKQLTEANLAKMKFLSIIAHDLRNPFNSLLGFSTLLLANYERYSDEKILEYLKYMSKAANQGHQLLENLLDWARANARKIEINPELFNVHDTISETVGLLSSSASKKAIAITHEISETFTVFADQNMIRTVIRNLISNALKFTPRGGLIKISSFVENTMLIVEVADNGVGISKEKLENLFSLSSDYSTLGTEKETGTGLGLILCNEFMTLNKGHIEASSEHGIGSVFSVFIPRFREN
jgi:two-component system, sensor histidine kinase and response regulator